MVGYHEYCGGLSLSNRGGLSLSNRGGCGVTWRAVMSNMEGAE